jgi:hypothetical protein
VRVASYALVIAHLKTDNKDHFKFIRVARSGTAPPTTSTAIRTATRRRAFNISETKPLWWPTHMYNKALKPCAGKARKRVAPRWCRRRQRKQCITKSCRRAAPPTKATRLRHHAHASHSPSPQHTSVRTAAASQCARRARARASGASVLHRRRRKRGAYSTSVSPQSRVERPVKH